MTSLLFPRADFMPRFYYTIALAAGLAGCACLAPRQASQTSFAPQKTSQTKTVVETEKTTAVKKQSLRRPATAHTKIAKPANTAAMENLPQSKEKSPGDLGRSTKVESPSISQSDGKSSAEFGEIKCNQDRNRASLSSKR